jgi:hypothetical protein
MNKPDMRSKRKMMGHAVNNLSLTTVKEEDASPMLLDRTNINETQL